MKKFDQAKYIQQFQKEKYDRCIFNVPKGQKIIIEAHWKKKGYKSLNAYINDLIRRDMEEEARESIKTINIGRDNNGTINL
jgi:hypothetical protein